MSQPPPPGGPPSGGFGPPPAEDPQQPGYGYPQTPPPPAPGGGFGAPQEPPPGQQPAQPPQYGYPPAQPHAQPSQPPQTPAAQPYGQPAQPPQEQPQYSFAQQAPPHSGGYPQAQVPGLPAQPAAQKVVPVWTVIAAVVAILVVAGGTGWFLTSDDDGAQAGGGGGGGGPKKSVSESKPASADGELLFGVPYPQVAEGATWPASGQWATEKIYAKAELNAVKGYDTKTGKEVWELPTDGLVCGASRAVTADGKAAMLVQDGKVSDPDDSYAPCTEVVFFDVDSGEELWQQHVASADENVRFEHVTIAGDRVIASGLSGSAAFPLSGGDPAWQTKPTTECKDHDYASDGTNLLGLVFCGSIDEDMKVQKVDPATGGIYWSYDVPDGVQSVQVLSVEPPVITIGAGKTTETDIFALDEGELRSKISLGTETEGPRYKPGCDYSGGAESCSTVAVDGDTMYLPSREHQGKSDYGDTNEIVAFDLDTGKPTKKYDAGEKRTMVPLRMENGKVIAYRRGTYDAGGEILAIDPKSAKEEVWLELPNDTAEAESTLTYSDRVPYIFAHGRFYLAQDLISDRDDLEYFALAFGSKDQ
ncbi:PQQ-binding-like beta-propeller repeat protein [Streptomyces sp. WMMC500]|uniref:outer membrane protein assembly factor BamB family protein n=1 Tax=Streptomyces sp. WMMC500 TaxID=3015154 RepID=UPI00248CF58E|nr:PQQ-binding-like beta-propeller repeat protein [Streptomyces sp. WMMC500]WBB58850.1 PQQ-binding-like beta-propeller repeat protein [Streptomyces sp. WMMC500]